MVHSKTKANFVALTKFSNFCLDISVLILAHVVIQKKERLLLGRHLARCRDELGLDCPLEVFEELFFEHHGDANFAGLNRAPLERPIGKYGRVSAQRRPTPSGTAPLPHALAGDRTGTPRFPAALSDAVRYAGQSRARRRPAWASR